MFQVKIRGWLFFILAVLMAFPAISDDWLYTVRRNDDATSLGNKYLINPYRIDEVLKHNQLNSSNDLKPGLVLKFPLNMLKFGPARVQVLVVQGKVTLHRGSSSVPLETALSIQLKDRIVTLDDGSVTLRFADKSELLLGSNSELTFDVLTRWGRTGMVDSRMRLTRGSVEGRVQTLEGPGAHFEVHTPSAVATVRGTEFRVRINDKQTSISYNEVSEGKVKVENRLTDELVREGFGLVTEKGKVTGKPVELLPAPGFTQYAKEYPAKPVKLAWQPDDRAKAYRVELFFGDNFKQQLSSQIIASNQVSFEQIESGTYSVRIRAIDVNDLEGLDASHQFTLNEAPSVPQNLTGKQKIWVGEQTALSWQTLEQAKQYHFELAKDASFAQILVSKKLEETQLSTGSDLAPGTYYWRVSGENEQGKGYYSQVAELSVELPAVPTIKDLADIEIGEAQQVAWQAVPNAQGYHWQLSHDKNFTDIALAGESEKAQVTLNDLEVGSYYIRVAAKGAYNQERYSQAKPFEVYEAGNGKNPFMLSSLVLILLIL